MDNYQQLAQSLSCEFKNLNLLKQALVHRSYLNENNDLPYSHNERLEFLGDAVLEIIVTEYLYHQFPDTPEGQLTNWRASLVNAKMLYEVARDLGIEKYLKLSKGEAKDKNKKSRQFILADAIEAIIGAIYLDQGYLKAQEFVKKNILNRLKDILDSQSYLDPKSRFQEKAQEIKGITPHYEVLKEEGPDHDKIFTVGLYLADEMVSSGQGSSKQEAQVEAASQALQLFKW